MRDSSLPSDGSGYGLSNFANVALDSRLWVDHAGRLGFTAGTGMMIRNPSVVLGK